MRRKPAHQILELADIARPVIALEPLDGRRLEALRRQTLLLGDAEEMAHEVGNVLEPLAQRRQPQRHDVQPVEQILAEQALVDLLLQVAIGGGDDADIGLIGVRPPTVVYSPSCSTRSSRVCASIGMSPISSRNSVPPSACSNRPT